MTAQNPIAFRPYDNDLEHIERIRKDLLSKTMPTYYWGRREPTPPQVTITDVIRFALLYTATDLEAHAPKGDQGIENEELKATIRLMEQESGLDAPLR